MTSLDLALIGNGTVGALVDPLGEVQGDRKSVV